MAPLFTWTVTLIKIGVRDLHEAGKTELALSHRIGARPGFEVTQRIHLAQKESAPPQSSVQKETGAPPAASISPRVSPMDRSRSFAFLPRILKAIAFGLIDLGAISDRQVLA